ncbi:MAG: hypothetical protein ACKO9Z_12220 [Planctomycetota bacterium]
MTTGQQVFGLALVAGMALIGLWTAWRQGSVVAAEPGDTPESAFFRAQAVRRMVIGLLLTVLGTMLGFAMILLEEPAQVIADMRDEADRWGIIFHLDDSQERFAAFYGGFWLAFFLVFFLLLAFLAWDVWKLRSFRLGLRRGILEEKRRMASGRGGAAG